MRNVSPEELFMYFLNNMIKNFKNTLMEIMFWTIIHKSE